MDLNPARHAFGESIAALRAQVKAMHEHNLDRPPSNPFPDQAGQAGPETY